MSNGNPTPPGESSRFAPADENRVIQSLWIGEISPLEWTCMQSFVRNGHEFHLYSYERPASLPVGVFSLDAREVLSSDRVFRNQRGKGKGSYACFSDLFRYVMLFQRGGWWVDMDVFCLKPFDFSSPYVLGAEDKPVGTGIIKAPSGCALLAQAIRDAERIDPATVRWNELGDVFAQAVHDQGLMNYVLRPETFSPLVWHETPDHVRGARRFVPSERNYAVHLYHEMWRRNRIDKWRSYGPDSALEILKGYANLAALGDEFPAAKLRVHRLWDWWRPRRSAVVARDSCGGAAGSDGAAWRRMRLADEY